MEGPGSLNQEHERQYLADQTRVAQLLQPTEELKRELGAAQVAADHRKLELQNVGKARLLRTELGRAQEARASMQQCTEEACGRCGRAEEAEQQAARALQHAQNEHARIAGEPADTQKAVEGLIRRVTKLHVARTLSADAQAAMKPSRLDWNNAAAMKLQVDRQYEEKTHRQTEAQAELDALSHHIRRFEEHAARLTRKPQYPVLGRHAREKEIALLRTARERLESELGELREMSRILTESLRLAERLLALGSAAWLPDSRCHRTSRSRRRRAYLLRKD